MVTPTLLNSLAWKGYLIFMCLNFSFIPLVYFCYPETANLTLEEVDWLFYEGDVVKRSRRVAKEGWEHAEGVNPVAAMETGSLSSGKREEEGVEKKEHTGL